MGTSIAMSTMASTLQSLREKGYQLANSAKPVDAAVELNHLCQGGTSLLQDAHSPDLLVKVNGADLMSLNQIAADHGEPSRLHAALQMLEGKSIQFVSAMVGGSPVSLALAELMLTDRHERIALRTSMTVPDTHQLCGQAAFVHPGADGFQVSQLRYARRGTGQMSGPDDNAFPTVCLDEAQVVAVAEAAGPMLGAVSRYHLAGPPPVRPALLTGR